MNSTEIVMKDTCELIRACTENRELNKISIDKKELMRIASLGNMQYLLLYSLLKTETDKEIAGAIRNIIKKTIYKSFIQMMCIKQLNELLEENKIRHQFLKGAILKTIYPSPEMREMSDVDIIIFQQSLDRTAELLEKNG